MSTLRRSVRVGLAGGSGLMLWGAIGLTALAGTAWSQAGPAVAASTSELSAAMWRSALSAGKSELAPADPLRRWPAEAGDPGLVQLRASLDALEANLAKRESQRREQAAEVEKSLAEALAGEQTPANLSKALKAAVEGLLLTTDRAAFVAADRIQQLIARAEAAARAAEANSEWIMANELFVRLDLLLEESGRFKPDVRRMNDRLRMIQFYVPDRLWELRDQRRREEGLKPLAPFNPTGDGYEARLKGINDTVVLKGLFAAARNNVERKPLRVLLAGGLDALRAMATTRDLSKVFAGLNNPDGRDKFLAFLDAKINDLRTAQSDPGQLETFTLVEDVIQQASKHLGVPAAAVLHEFGNGAFDRLDEFSQIFWPDQLAGLKRITEGQFVGVGIQIQTDEDSQFVKVIAPLEGTPAFRAGVRAGDLIKKIDGRSALGITTGQAIELITGRAGTQVTLTLERDGEDVEFTLNREVIPLRTVKGWKRTGDREDQWDWFIDPSNRIGYVRLTSFNESSTSSTTRELREALAQMQSSGLNGLILDLRFNPGGLLPQAVSVTNTFVDSGLVVYTETADGTRVDEHSARPSGVRLRNVPIAVLVNEGSASASEIVSGALQHYNDTGKIRAIVIGQRSFGKGSVQNVLDLSGSTAMKLTTQYYFLPNGKLIHRKEGASTWGVMPHLSVEMLPKQISDALTLRQDADTPLAFFPGAKDKDGKPREQPDPDRLLTEGLDLQLQAALFVLQSQTLPARPAEAAAAPAAAKPG
jgi:carboxyl-terminal processing protease